jgi:hypothetical protein
MPRSLSFDDTQKALAEAIRGLDTTRGPSSSSYAGGNEGALNSALRATALALAASLGECRRAAPYAPLHPVIRADGTFSWCCNHDPEHCAT